LNHGLCGEKPVNDCLSHGTAFVVVVAVVIIVAITTAPALFKYSYTKIFYLK
jgi:low affinity Fe/Cu permease